MTRAFSSFAASVAACKNCSTYCSYLWFHSWPVYTRMAAEQRRKSELPSIVRPSLPVSPSKKKSLHKRTQNSPITTFKNFKKIIIPGFCYSFIWEEWKSFDISAKRRRTVACWARWQCYFSVCLCVKALCVRISLHDRALILPLFYFPLKIHGKTEGGAFNSTSNHRSYCKTVFSFFLSFRAQSTVE